MKKSKLDKKILHRLFLLVIILLVPAFMVKEYRIILAKKDTKVLPAPDFFQAKLQECNNKTFVFIVLTKNNVETIEENFRSIETQQYPNFRVVYIDHDSKDGTPEKIQELIEHQGEKDHYTLIKAEKDYEAYRAYFETVSSCENDDVVIHIEGCDFLAHDGVLNRMSRAYTNSDVWLTYGQYFDYHSYKKGILEPKPQKTLYKKRIQRAPWMLASLKTFYAGHFKNIRRADAQAEEFFLSMESFDAFHMPLVELAKAHVQFIPDVLYVHAYPVSKKRKKMKLAVKGESFTRSVHQALPQEQKYPVDVILFSSNSNGSLQKCLQSMHEHMKGIGQISVMLESQENLDDNLRLSYPNVTFVETSTDFKTSFMTALIGSENSSSYIVLASDQIMVQEDFSLMPCIEAMRKTNAYGFYFHLGKRGEEAGPHGIYSWSIEKAKGPWRDPNTLKMALYRKIDLEKDFKEMSFANVSDLIDLWSVRKQDTAIGLAYDHSPLTIR